MKTVFSEDHRLYRPRFDLVNGKPAETASPYLNAEIVLEAVKRDLGAGILPPEDHGRAPFLWVHDAAYLDFLETAWEEWVALYGDEGEAIPLASVQRGMHPRVPETIDGKLSYYALDIGTPISGGTWQAVYASGQVALTAAEMVAAGIGPVYALCRPGGHHAGPDYYGGYCFLSTEGLAAAALRRAGAARVTYLDVDYHHCNGTQAIFYEDPAVQVVSLHCDPRFDYPYFSGYAEERGAGAGEGATLNLPLPPGTTWTPYAEALETALASIRRFDPDVLVVLAGVDTFEKDSISKFKLTLDAFPRIGEAIAGLGRPSLFVKGGGYSKEGLDRCVTALLGGYLEAGGR